MYMEVHFLPSLRFIFSRASYLLPLFMPSDISEVALKPYLFNFYFRTKPWNPDGFLGQSPKSLFFFRWGHRGRTFLFIEKKERSSPNLYFEFGDLLCQILNTPLILLR